MPSRSPVRVALLVLIASSSLLGVAQTEPRVLASTSWTAAIARAAGLTDVQVLAPVDMQHPPEYALQPSDLVAAANADVVIYAGYERFASRLVEAAGNADAIVVQVTTQNAPAPLDAAVRQVAERVGTLPAYERWRATFGQEFTSLRERARPHTEGVRVVVHAMMRPQVEALGFEIVGGFGPGPITPGDLAAVREQEPDLIIDNAHNPIGQSLEEASGARRVAFINFPGQDATESLLDVVRRNVLLIATED